jgi:hypothetical protein
MNGVVSAVDGRAGGSFGSRGSLSIEDMTAPPFLGLMVSHGIKLDSVVDYG